nr:hypothetical protein [uncultured Agrobacterium sp.]
MVNHAVLRGIMVAPLVWWVRPADTLPGVRVFNHLVFVPDDLAHIELVAEDACAALCPAVDRAGCPGRGAWGRDALGLQIGGDVSRGLTLRELPEDTLDDLDLFRHRDQLALVRRVGLEAVCLPTSRQPALDQALHTAPHLAGVVLAKELGDDGAEADCDGRGRTLVDADDLDAEILHPLVDARHVLHVAAYTVELFNHDHVEQMILGVGQ